MLCKIERKKLKNTHVYNVIQPLYSFKKFAEESCNESLGHSTVRYTQYALQQTIYAIC